MKRLNCVLLIDDDEIDNILSFDILNELDFSNGIKVINNGNEAIDFLKKCSLNLLPAPELILLDRRMPGLDGEEFLKAFLEMTFVNQEHIRIIILTAYITALDLNKLKELGASDCLIKPLTVASLKEAILKIKKSIAE